MSHESACAVIGSDLTGELFRWPPGLTVPVGFHKVADSLRYPNGQEQIAAARDYNRRQAVPDDEPERWQDETFLDVVSRDHRMRAAYEEALRRVRAEAVEDLEQAESAGLQQAAAAFGRHVAARRGEDWIDRMQDYYREPWIPGDHKARLTRLLCDLRVAGVDVRGAMDQAERELREVEADVPVRRGEGE